MDNLVIFVSPILLPLYGASLLLAILSLFFPKTGYILPIASFAFLVASSIWAVILGAPLFEIALFVVLFLIIHIIGFRRAKA